MGTAHPICTSSDSTIIKSTLSQLQRWRQLTNNKRTSKLKLKPISSDWFAILKLSVCRCIWQKTTHDVRLSVAWIQYKHVASFTANVTLQICYKGDAKQRHSWSLLVEKTPNISPVSVATCWKCGGTFLQIYCSVSQQNNLENQSALGKFTGQKVVKTFFTQTDW